MERYHFYDTGGRRGVIVMGKGMEEHSAIRLQRMEEKIYLGTKQLRFLLLFSEEET